MKPRGRKEGKWWMSYKTMNSIENKGKRMQKLDAEVDP